MTDTLSILLFVRTPEKGKVKSRLAAELGEEMAVVIYKSFVLDILAMLLNGPYPLTLCVHPPHSGEALADWLGPSLTYVPQEGNDLGEKMKNAFVRSFSGRTERAVLIGSDIPDLSMAIIDEAFVSLDTCDAVIGPASDGGYYLIGFRRDRFLPGIFEGIPWGTEAVCGKTLGLFHCAGCRVHVLPEWHDIDTADDLKSLFARNEHSPFRESKTMSFIWENRKDILGRGSL
jgi:hypothetical protein